MTAVLHPWHGASYGDKAPAQINGLVEIPQGSRAKYEVDKTTGLLKLDRVIYSSFHYPVNYGFIPQTLGYDGDPLDILIICSQSIQPLCLIETAVIGNMQMIDAGKQDDKIIAVAVNDPSVNHIKSMEELPSHFLAELRNFFEQYKVLENKKVMIDNFQDRATALRIINDAIDLYKQTFKK
ncbi:MAG TPA: inorganic diphosphatase [Chitinophagaceae bacterium]|jgi:inorganic pyrophosphatase|nr:inorganic diphosphatase [Chitinophagaceae bacterium]HMW65497.1 inorganic diphosphatase [Chitinophagaceae bacterium]HMX77491.1 inorganic diphosphatase [Chitinophagaceae bacterium]HNA19110.1 inorganic diphosphatase [Chitinophagaceae bacterium]HNA91644.1 inorganic diphosphatase [Chitinophagaceae bacterium]